MRHVSSIVDRFQLWFLFGFVWLKVNNLFMIYDFGLSFICFVLFQVRQAGEHILFGWFLIKINHDLAWQTFCYYKLWPMKPFK